MNNNVLSGFCTQKVKLFLFQQLTIQCLKVFLEYLYKHPQGQIFFILLIIPCAIISFKFRILSFISLER